MLLIKDLACLYAAPFLPAPGSPSATHSQVYWVGAKRYRLVSFGGGIASGRKRVARLGIRHCDLRVAGMIDFEATVGIEAGRGAGTGLMPDQRDWWKRASIWAGVAALP